MSNATGGFGLRPIRMRDGTPWNGAVEKCYVASAYATPIYVGSVVQIETEADHYDATGMHM